MTLKEAIEVIERDHQMFHCDIVKLLKGLVDATDPKVTQGVKNKLADVQVLWKNEKAKLDGINTAVNNFNSLYQKANIEAVQK